MKGRLTVVLAILLIVPMGFVGLFSDVVRASPGTTIAIEPGVSGKAPNEFFSINVTISEVTALYTWQFNMTFDRSVLEVTDVVEGPFLKTAGKTKFPTPSLNNSAGWLQVGCARFPYDAGANGTGVLATVTFKVSAEGQSQLKLQSDTKLRSWNGSILVPISFTMVDGSFRYPLFTIVHNVAVTDVVVSSLAVAAGDRVSVNVTVANRGDLTEAFGVTLFCDSWVVGTQTVSSVFPGTSRTLVFEWDTTNVDAGDYVLTAVAGTVAQETNTLDNTFAYAAVTVTEAAPPLPFELIALMVVVVVLVVISVVLLLKFPRQSQSLSPEKERA